ncbi:MAG: glycine--tRNA ligase [Verrucomicrobiales bacterium]|nr:glycine--tRNA ligase [Verrucomicrobiales bacterium]
MAEPKENVLMEKIVSLCKRRGFIYQSSEIYGGINGFWDYGPLGAELKRNVKDLWWRTMVHTREDVVGLEATIIMHPQIWKASGHVDTFSDPMCDCLLTGKRFRADQVEPQSGSVVHYVGAVEFDALLGALKRVDEAAVPTGNRGINVAVRFESDLPGEKRLREVAVSLASTSDPKIATLDRAALEQLGPKRFSEEYFAVLLPPGKPIESATKLAQQFYDKRGLKGAFPIHSQIEKVEGTTRFNPDNGALLTEPRPFNLMFKTFVGASEPAEAAYLRPETAQAIFAQFKNVVETSRQKVPFGIAQMGKAFRNEVTPRNFTFRSREFEQMELEFFIKPDEAVEAISGTVAKASDLTPHSALRTPRSDWGWEAWHKYWVEERILFYENIGLPRTTLEEYWQKPEELAHYARATVDILFKFPFGTQELEGIAARSDFDLSQHERCSGKPMGVFDEELRGAWAKLDETKKKELWQSYYTARLKYLLKVGEPWEKADKEAKEDADGLAKGQYIPHVIEPSAGVDRLILALIANAYTEDQAPDEKGKMETRIVMKFHPRIAPIKVAVFPLLRNKPDLVKKAREVRDLLLPHMTVFYDDAGAIGRRYRRQDEAGTPFGLTIDFETLGEAGPEIKDTVTLRDRDTMQQTRVKIDELVPLLRSKIH